jgi:cobalt-zinc-cadmium efflux system protein
MSDHRPAHDHHGHDDHNGHEHGHTHRPGRHVHAPASFGRAFAIGIGLNLVYLVAEAFFGVLAHSVALLADAGHNLTDVLGLAAAWVATRLAAREPSERFTYGLGRSSVLAALGNAVALLLITGAIGWEALRRLAEPHPVSGVTIIVVAAIGIVVNGGTALLFMRGRKGDLNIRGAFLHMAADALVAAGVVVTGILIISTGWPWLDPVIGLAVSAIIVASTWSLLRDSVQLSLDAVPVGIDRTDVYHYLHGLPGVMEVHDLHIWALSTTESALTAHLVGLEQIDGAVLLPQVSAELKRRFGIGHATLQIETLETARLCGLRPDHVV